MDLSHLAAADVWLILRKPYGKAHSFTLWAPVRRAPAHWRCERQALTSGATARWLLGASIVAASLTGGPVRAGEPAGLPARNLLVQVQEIEHRNAASSSQGLDHAGLTVNSRTGVSGSAAVGWSVGTDRRQHADAQQIMVLNGGRAQMHAGSNTPRQWWSVVWTAQGAQALPSTVWADTGSGWSVHPVWSGKGQMVKVEIAAQSSRAVDPNLTVGGDADAGAATVSRDLLTTVQIPLDQWVTIASTASQREQHASGVLRSGDASASEGLDLQIKITLP